MDDSNEHKGNSSPSSLKEMLKSSLCLSCCLRKHRNGHHHHHHHHHHHRRMSISSDGDSPGPLMRCSSAKDKSRSRESPEIKDRRPHFISRLGRHGRRHSASADFRYDALSYALNFDEGYDEGHVDDDFPLRNFSSRLPASPRKSSPSSSNASREMITAFS
ncbi:homeobox protein MOX-2 [Benincasa hispida]|uniref:homeobox protein MOX-2 n=1 Tax=Benincasa hispida TaxID=102211 RepID=UPI0018FF9A87|nr:homeobox protein MOX-2 [Benincasa hispida]